MPAAANIHAFFGTDEALVKEAALRLCEKLAPPDNEFGLEIVAGGADNADHAVQIVGRTFEAIQTLPFFGGDKVVWLQAVNFLADNQTGKAESTLAAVESLVELLERGLPPDVKFVLSAGEVDKRRSFYKRLSKIAKVETYDKLDTTKAGWEGAVMGHVRERAAALKLVFVGGALEAFVHRTGANTRSIDSELEKLSLFVGDRRATEEDVEQVVAASHTGIVFEIGNALSRRDLPRVLALIDEQLRKGENAIGILLASIVPTVRKLLQAKDLVESHRLSVGNSYPGFQKQLEALPPSATDHLARNKDGSLGAYPIYLAARDGGKFTAAELRKALEACLEANLRLVTSSLAPQLVLHQLAARALARPDSPQPATRR